MILKAIVDRWGPMWPAGFHGERPWWRVVRIPGPVTDSYPPIYPWRWERADGVKGPEFYAREREIERRVEDTEALAAIDTANPLPPPGPMPGQVWVVGEDEVLVPSLLPSVGRPFVRAWPCFVDGVEVDPEKGAVLVAGPTPWGRDVPWGRG